MKKTPSERRLIENEILSRTQNKFAKNAVKKYFKPEKNINNIDLEFNCECSDLKCQEKVRLTIEEYEEIHSRKDRFVLSKNHASPNVEKIVADKNGYSIVEKFAIQPQTT